MIVFLWKQTMLYLSLTFSTVLPVVSNENEYTDMEDVNALIVVLCNFILKNITEAESQTTY